MSSCWGIGKKYTTISFRGTENHLFFLDSTNSIQSAYDKYIKIKECTGLSINGALIEGRQITVIYKSRNNTQ